MPILGMGWPHPVVLGCRLAIPERPIMLLQSGALGHVVSVDMEANVHHVGSQSINHAYAMEPQLKLRIWKLR